MPLIIAIGNALRGDDGVGPLAAAALDRPGVDVITDHQLLPEMAEAISQADRVLFLDVAAGGTPGAVTCRHLAPADTPDPTFTHRQNPESLLAMARDWYGSVPPACLITVAGASFALSETLSAPVAAAVPALLSRAWEFLAGP